MLTKISVRIYERACLKAYMAQLCMRELAVGKGWRDAGRIASLSGVRPVSAQVFSFTLARL